MNDTVFNFKYWVSLLARLSESLDDQGHAALHLLKECENALQETLAANNEDQPASDDEVGLPENSPVPVLTEHVKKIIRSLLTTGQDGMTEASRSFPPE